MLRIVSARHRPNALLPVGIVFVLIGAGRRWTGESAAFVLVGSSFVVIGLREWRHAAAEPSG